jgi:NAD(P)H-nitrite reductase large subunit
MNLDDKICYCFHVTRRKLENFVRREQPRVASQMSQCGGAGTGCGWCIPFLKRIFSRELIELEQLTPADYAAQRADYVRGGGGTPPPGAEPLPGDPGDSAQR